MESKFLRLLNDWQQDFPRVAEPFSVLGKEVGMEAEETLGAFRLWYKKGLLSRIGPVFNQNYFGASALVALAVPRDRLEAVASYINVMPEVNHNYEREHYFNLWFVVIASSKVHLQDLMVEITSNTDLVPIVLPMEEAYHINLGFDLLGQQADRAQQEAVVTPLRYVVEGSEKTLLHAIQDGIPLVARPYEEIGKRVGLLGSEVCEILEKWLSLGVLRRFSVVLRHHELGYTANAMCVWDVADGDVTSIGMLLGAEPGVTLCYRRRRALPHWRYNLFCMIHGKGREEVLAKRIEISRRLALDDWPHDVLFSSRRFKQCGAKFST
jgi:DNA-binding Lrp family transcriptional regulator